MRTLKELLDQYRVASRKTISDIEEFLAGLTIEEEAIITRHAGEVAKEMRTAWRDKTTVRR